MPTITPYVLHTQSVVNLISELQDRYGGELKNVFKHQKNKVTEFFLYFAYLVKYSLLYIYENQPSKAVTLFTIWPQDFRTVSKLLESAKGDEILVLGIHRNRLPQLSVLHIELINYIFSKSLLKPWENLSWFFEYHEEKIVSGLLEK